MKKRQVSAVEALTQIGRRANGAPPRGVANFYRSVRSPARSRAHASAFAVAVGLGLYAVPAAAYDVSDEASLRAAIESVNAGTATTINLLATIPGNIITLTSELPAITNPVTITGNGNTISGNNQFRVFFIAAGTNQPVSISGLTIANGRAVGGSGGSGGGGGMGAGGGIFAMSGDITLTDVSFSGNEAFGGSGGSGFGGGGGGMGGNGGTSSGPFTPAGGGGGLGVGASGGGYSTGTAGAPGIVTGAASGGAGGGGPAGANGGGGGQGHNTNGAAGGGGGIAGGAGTPALGGDGGFGGGGGGTGSTWAGHGGFGGGGGAGGFNGEINGGLGGFGGGGGGSPSPFSGGNGGTIGGFGGGKGGIAHGGGGMGAGGAVFVCSGTVDASCGATLKVVNTADSTLNGTVAGGDGANAGAAYGGSVFITGSSPTEFAASAGTTTTISGSIVGINDQGLALSGGGTFDLQSTANSFNGLSLSGAGTTIRVISENTLGGGDLAFGDGTGMEFAASGTYTRRLDLAGTIGLDTGAAGRAVTWSGLVRDGTGIGILDITGQGTLTLTNIANSYSGGTVVRDGATLSIGSNTVLGDPAGGITLGDATSGGTLNTTTTFSSGRDITIEASGGTVNVNSGTAWSNTGDISGDGALTKEGAGLMVVLGDASHSGGTTINEGTLQIGSGGGPFGTLDGDVVNHGVLAFNRTGPLDIDGDISGSGSVSQAGAGVTVLNGANTYQGATNVTLGTLRAGSDDAFSASSAFTVGINTTLDLDDRDQTIGSLAGSGVVDLGSGTLTTGGNGGTTTFSGSIAGTGGLIKEGAGAFTISSLAGNTTYSGATEINEGSIVGGGTNALSAASTVDIASGGMLDLGGFDQTIAGISGDGTVTNNGSAGATLVVGDAGDHEFSGVIQDGTAQTGLNKRGTGTLTLTGENAYGGGTTVTNGTLRIGDGGTSGSVAGAILLQNASKLVIDRSDTLAMSNVIAGNGSLEMTGGGTLTLTGSNSYQAGTTISEHSTIAITDAASLGDPGGGLTFDDGTLRIGGTNPIIAHHIRIDAGGGTFETVGNSGYTLSGNISGSGDLTFAGTGGLVLTGNNTHDGATNISHSNLFALGGNAIGDRSAVDLAYNSWLILNDSETIGSLSGSGTLLGNGTAVTLTTGGDDNSTTFSGMLTETAGFGRLSLVKTGTGTLILSGASNNYSGGTTIEDGAISISSNANLGAASDALILGGATATGTLIVTESLGSDRDITIEAGGGAVDVAATRTWTNAGGITGTGDIEKLGGGTLVLTGDNSGHSGDLAISAGVLQVGNGGADGTLGSGGVEIADDALLRFDRTGTVSVAGDISGDGVLEMVGAGTLVLSGNNSYSGGTTLDGGTIRVESDSALGTGNLLVLGSTLDIAGGTAIGNDIDLDDDLAINVDTGTGTHTGVIADNVADGGSGGIVKTGGGTLFLTGDNTYSGGTTIAEGTLRIESANAVAGSSGALRLEGGRLLATESLILLKSLEVDDDADATVAASGSKELVLGGDSGQPLVLGDDATLRFGSAIDGEGIVELGYEAVNTDSAASLVIQAGGVRLGNATSASLFSISGISVYLEGGASLILDGHDISLPTLAHAGASGGTIVNGAATDATVTLGSDADSAFGGDILDGTGGGTTAVVKQGSGTLSLSGDSDHSGGTSLEEGTIRVLSDTALGSGTVFARGGSLHLAGPTNTTVSLVNHLELEDDLGIVVGAGRTGTLGGDITDYGAGPDGAGIIKTGAGTLVLAGTNDYLGRTSIEEGRLRAEYGLSLSEHSTYAIGATGTLELAGGEIGAIAALEDGTDGGGEVLLGDDSLLAVAGAGATSTFSGS